MTKGNDPEKRTDSGRCRATAISGLHRSLYARSGKRLHSTRRMRRLLDGLLPLSRDRRSRSEVNDVLAFPHRNHPTTLEEGSLRFPYAFGLYTSLRHPPECVFDRAVRDHFPTHFAAVVVCAWFPPLRPASGSPEQWDLSRGGSGTAVGRLLCLILATKTGFSHQFRRENSVNISAAGARQVSRGW